MSSDPSADVPDDTFGVDRVSPPERLGLIGEIGDGLASAVGRPPGLGWHRPEVERRRAAAEADPGAGILWEVVKARLAERP